MEFVTLAFSIRELGDWDMLIRRLLELLYLYFRTWRSALMDLCLIVLGDLGFLGYYVCLRG